MSHERNPVVLGAEAVDVRIAERDLVAGLDLSLQAGDWLALLGRNGSGKSCTLRTLCGLVPAASGRLTWCGERSDQIGTSHRARLVSMVTQHQDDAFANDVFSHLLMGRYPHHGAWRGPTDGDRRRVHEVLNRLGLTPLAGRDVGTLSGGERQRVAVGQALVQDTPLLLLDEPLSHQDPAGCALILSALHAYQQHGGTLVTALHDVNLARRHATHALILDGVGGWTKGSAIDTINRSAVQRLFGVEVADFEVEGQPWFVPLHRGQGAASTGCSMPVSRS